MKSFISSICLGLGALVLALGSCASTAPSASEAKDSAPAVAKSGAAASAKSDISGLFLPGLADKAKPAGSACDLEVLNWAGFEGAASYTFDDGQPTHVAHWKDLKATGVPMTFFLVSSSSMPPAVVKVWKDVLASGSELGNHTDTHKWSKDYPGGQAEMEQDIQKCETMLSDKLGQTAEHSFAYPFGELAWKDTFKGRFLFARSVYSGSVEPLDETDPLILPIFAVQANQTKDDFNSALDQNADDKTWVIFMFHSILPGDNWFAGVQTKDVVESIEHAKSGGRIWMDTMETVGAYWLGQKIFAEVQAQDSGNGKTWTWKLPEHFPAHKFLRVKVEGGTLSQNGVDLPWNAHGFYEVALDAGTLAWKP